MALFAEYEPEPERSWPSLQETLRVALFVGGLLGLIAILGQGRRDEARAAAPHALASEAPASR